jgi:hypothetical protein
MIIVVGVLASIVTTNAGSNLLFPRSGEAAPLLAYVTGFFVLLALRGWSP